MDFQRIMRVIIWHAPLSFLSLVQKIGRCVRLAELLGEAILYVTGAAFIRYEIELEILKDGAEDDMDADEGPEQPEQLVDGEQMDRDAAVETQEETEQHVAPKRKSKKVMSVMEARDRRFLLEYIVTKGCRRLPWNKFFGNDSKCKSSLCISSQSDSGNSEIALSGPSGHPLLRQLRPRKVPC